MTLNNIYLKGKEILKNADIDDYTFDTLCIFEHCFNLKRQELIEFRDENASIEKENEFFNYINERKTHKPLQYILGHWYFMSRKFKVKEEVLIPRDDTEVLVNAAIDLIKNKKDVKILDLCSGTGIIAITLGDIFKDFKIIAADISDISLNVLKENITLNKINNIIIKKIDVFDDRFAKEFKNVDLIVSNPPYIPQNEIDNLQKEVQFEPLLALNGGIDGLDFYRAISKNFKNSLKNGGNICFEIGTDQFESVKKILECNGFSDVKMVKDINNVERVVFATFK